MTNTLTLGVLATLYGPFVTLGEDAVRGVQLAIDEFGGEIAGHTLQMAVEGTIGMPDGAAFKAEELIKRNKAQILVGPLSGNEGLAIRNLADQYPHITFVNGSSGAQELTLHDTPPNFFNFALNGAQIVAGIGDYAYQELGYRRVVTLGENYSYPHAQIGSFLLEFHRHGGEVLDRIWVRLGESDFTDAIARIPADVDAIFLALGGTDAIEFIQQYREMADPKPIFGGGIITDQTVLSSPDIDAEYLRGVIAGGPTADDYAHPLWGEFVDRYRAAYPDGLNYPSYFATQYYINAKAALQALEQVNGDLSNNHAALNDALRALEFDGPCGPVWLDANHGAVGNSFITQVDQDEQGRYYRRLLREITHVDQALGIPLDEFLSLGAFTADNPSFSR